MPQSSKTAVRRTAIAVAIATATGVGTVFGSISAQDQESTPFEIDVDTPVSDAPDAIAPRSLDFETDSDINSSLGVTLLIPDVSDVFVGIFDNMGVPVTSYRHTYTMSELWELERAADGRWRLDVEWNGRTANGTPAPRGVYIWKIIVQSREGAALETTRKLGLR